MNCRCVGLYDIVKILNSDPEFVRAYGRPLQYRTVVKWIQRDKFSTAHKINGGTWVVSAHEIKDWQKFLQLSVVGAINYRRGNRREWTEFYNHYVPLLAAAFPYRGWRAINRPDSQEVEKDLESVHTHTLRVLRENHPWIPEGDEIVARTIKQNKDFTLQGGYPRKVLARKLTEYYMEQLNREELADVG